MKTLSSEFIVESFQLPFARAGNVKLCDFGIAGRLVDSKVTSRDAGVAGYIAPERVDPNRAGKEYDVRADVWSLGEHFVYLESVVGDFHINSAERL